MAAEKAHIPDDHKGLCVGSGGGGGPDGAVFEKMESEQMAAREIVEVDPREVARYKQKLRKFKLSAFVTVLALALGFGVLLGVILDQDMPQSLRPPFILGGAAECLIGLYGIYGHLKEFGLSFAKITDFSNEEHPPPPLGHDRC